MALFFGVFFVLEIKLRTLCLPGRSLCMPPPLTDRGCSTERLISAPKVMQLEPGRADLDLGSRRFQHLHSYLRWHTLTQTSMYEVCGDKRLFVCFGFFFETGSGLFWRLALTFTKYPKLASN